MEQDFQWTDNTGLVSSGREEGWNSPGVKASPRLLLSVTVLLKGSQVSGPGFSVEETNQTFPPMKGISSYSCQLGLSLLKCRGKFEGK